MVEGLERDARRDRSVADHRDGAAVGIVRSRHRVSERGRDARSRVGEQVVVVRALLGRRVAGEAVPLPDRGELVAAAREDLVRVGLMRDVPDQDVLQEVVDVVERDREVDDAEAGREVSAVLLEHLGDELADLRRDHREVGERDLPQVGGVVDSVEDGHEDSNESFYDVRSTTKAASAARCPSRSRPATSRTASAWSSRARRLQPSSPIAAG